MPTEFPARFRSVHFGVDSLDLGIVLARHRRTAGYATVVLAGSFDAVVEWMD